MRSLYYCGRLSVNTTAVIAGVAGEKAVHDGVFKKEKIKRDNDNQNDNDKDQDDDDDDLGEEEEVGGNNNTGGSSEII